ncbi:MAG TPA: FHA domain-containing protein [Actinomycetota bacterium]
MTRYAIIGDGAAGTTAAFFIRRADPSGRVIILSDDPQPAYYRAALTNFLIGELREEQLFAVPPNFYTEFRVERFQARVGGVDTRAGVLTLANGGTVPYDQLLIAAGSNPNLPPWPGADLAGVMTMRTMQDARAVMDGLASKQIRRAVVVGAGPLGIEWVQGLRTRGVEVTYVVRGDTFMEHLLDRTASDLVWSRLRANGVDLRLNEEVAEVLPTSDGRARGVRLKSGQTVEAQLVGVAIGIRAATEFLNGSEVRTERGIPVDQHMRTNVPNVYAAGDVASVLDPASGQHRGFGLWEPARLQGRTAGVNMSGGRQEYRMGVQYTATRLWDLDLGAVGRTIERDGDQVIPDFPRTGREIRYRKLVVRDGRLVGALMLGHRRQAVRSRALQFQRLIELGLDVSEVASGLLDPRSDLASWLEAHDPHAGRPSEGVAAAAGNVPTNSVLRRGSMVVDLPDLPATLGRQGAPSVTLTVQGTGQSFELDGPVIRIGRHPDNDIVLPDEYVSAHHAEVRLEVGSYMVSDAGSRNGTFINDVPVMAPAPLRQADVIRVGATSLSVTVAADQVAPSAGFGAQAPRAPQPPAPGAPPAVGGPPPSGVAVPAPVPSMAPVGALLGYLQLDGRRFDLAEQTVNLGRDPSSDVAIDDPAVSYTHAQVTRLGNDLYLRDVGSRNGTYVNAQLVSVPHLLTEGDVIHVGTTDLTFHAVGGPMPATAPPPSAPPPFPAASPGPAIIPPVPPVAPPVAPVAPLSPPSEVTGPMPPGPGPQTPGPPVPGPAAVTPAAPGGPRLRVTVGPMVGLSFALGRETLRVGRDPSSDVVLRDQTVSRSHAQLEHRQGRWIVTDLGSTNGTAVGGRQLQPRQSAVLDPGTTVQFGDIVCLFEGP